MKKKTDWYTWLIRIIIILAIIRGICELLFGRFLTGMGLLVLTLVLVALSDHHRK